MDFSNTLVYKQSQYKGIAVIKLPAQPSHPDLLIAISTLVKGLEAKSIDGQLWIIQRGRIREYVPRDSGD
jgi:hypothetical protein